MASAVLEQEDENLTSGPVPEPEPIPSPTPTPEEEHRTPTSPYMSRMNQTEKITDYLPSGLKFPKPVSSGSCHFKCNRVAAARDLREHQLLRRALTLGERISMCPCFLGSKQSIVNLEDDVISTRRRSELPVERKRQSST